MAQLASPAKAPPAKTAPRSTPAPMIQAKLEVGAANDHFEREADRVAASVMSGTSAPVSIPPSITPIGAQRKATPPKKEEERKKAPASSRPAVQRKAAPPAARREEEKKAAAPAGGRVQRKAAPPAAKREEEKKSAGAKPVRAQREAAAGPEGGTASASVDSAIQAMQSGPAPGLDGSTRSFMEGRFGRDFSGVRVHHDQRAAQAAEAVGARAFTTGNDIFFNTGQYQPNSSGGRQLIAHELTHTVQQGSTGRTAARKRIQRTPPSPPAPVVPDPAQPLVTTFTSVRLPGAAVDTTNVEGHKGTVTLPVLTLPLIAGAMKGAAGGETSPVATSGRSLPAQGVPFTLAPVPERSDARAYQIWTQYAKDHLQSGIRTKILEMKDNTPDRAPIFEGTEQVYYLTYRATRSVDRANIFIGTIGELVENEGLLRPQWNPRGQSLTGREASLQADHVLELQIGGEDSGANMWLLQGAYNMRVGNQIKTNIENDLRVIKSEVDGFAQMDPAQKPGSISEIKREWVMHFLDVRPGTNFGTATTDYWTQGQIAGGVHLNQLKIMTETELQDAGILLRPGVRPERIRVFPSAGGGRMATVALNPGTDEVRGGSFLYQNIFTESGTYFPNALGTPESPLMTLNVVINKRGASGPAGPIPEKRGPIDVLSNPRRGIAGYVSNASIRRSLSGMEFNALSPLTFSDMGVSPEGELTGTGSVGSSKAIFPGLAVPLELRGDRIMMNFPIPQGQMDLGPLHVTQMGLTLGVGSRGLFLEGYAGFEISGLGTGSVTAEASAEPRLTGVFNLAMDFLQPASVTVLYEIATDTLTATLEAGVPQGRIPGVESGRVTVGITRDAVDVTGSLNLGGALRGTVINVSYTQAEGLRIGADNIPLPLSSIPAIQNATLSISASRPPEGGEWSFAGRGQATLAVPGATGTIAIDYLNGGITFTANAQVAKGPATGTLTFTATNRAIDEEGRPVEGPPIDGINVWGRGSVTIRFGNLLTGTAGVELTPDNRVIISGAIGLPPVFEIFPRREYNRDLFTLSPPEFPIWGVSVAGVGVGIFAFVDARVAFNAYVGPGEIRNAQIGATLDLDRPEEAAITGHADFVVPAYAGLSLDVGGGLRARLAVAYAEGRVGLTGALGIEAGASAAIDIAWNRSDGLALSADLQAQARPKFELSANASVTVGVDLLVTDVSHTFGPWRRVLGSFGPDMTLGVRMPVRWSEAEGLDLSLENIEVTRPSLDASALMTSVFERLAA